MARYSRQQGIIAKAIGVAFAQLRDLDVRKTMTEGASIRTKSQPIASHPPK
jgi:hypothetical protein